MKNFAPLAILALAIVGPVLALLVVADAHAQSTFRCVKVPGHEQVRLPAHVSKLDVWSADGTVRLDRIDDRRAQHAWIFDGIEHGAPLNGLWDTRRGVVANGERRALRVCWRHG